MNPTSPSPQAIDKAADVAQDAVQTARKVTTNVLDSAESTVENVRSSVSPMLNTLVDYTRKDPIKALGWAVFAGVVLSAISGIGRSR